ncbi:MAG: DUF4097 family beta strand repeat-containing protein [Candidatus Aminicenantes bacterium]
MKTTTNRTRLSVVFLALFLLLCAGLTYGTVEETINKSFTVRPGGNLTVDTDKGSIDVEAIRGNTVDVEIVQYVRAVSKRRAQDILDDFRVHFDQDGADVFIKAEYRKTGIRRFWNRLTNRLRVKFFITVPQEYNVGLHTSGGSITVENLEGEVESRTSGGKLTFENISGDIFGKTSGGSIRIGEVDGDVNARTSGGSIRITRASGNIDVHTSGGGITVEEVMGSIQASTSGGSVMAYISRQPEADCRLKTSGGSITVYLGDDVGLDVNARTSGGRIHTDFPVKVYGTISPRSLDAEVNGGGPELTLRTSGGGIHIKKK